MSIFCSTAETLTTVHDGSRRELAYIVELDELEAAITDALTRIRERDGDAIFREVAERLRDSIAVDVEIAPGKGQPKNKN
jgi:hypothetical protein